MRKTVGSATLRALRSLGAFSLAGSSQHRSRRLLILCYHGISLQDEHLCWPHLYVTPEQFRGRLQCLKNSGASVLPLDEAVTRLQEGSLPPRSVALTFDDGFYDFLKYGVPILSEFRYPCTLYLTTHYAEYRLPIISLVLDYIIWKSGRRFLSLPHVGVNEPLPVETFEERQVIVKHILNLAEQKGLDTPAKDEVAQGIARELGVDYSAILDNRLLQILSPAEVHDVAKAGIDIELHTHRHRIPKDSALFRREIEDNRRRIVEWTGKTPVHFCYPSGQYSPEFFGWLRGCGVRTATTCESGLALPDSEPMKLPRVLDDSGMNLVRFQAVLSGLFV